MSDSPNGSSAHEAIPTPEGWDTHGTADATLGGYLSEHDRPPAFEGSDGEPYTVSIEAERTPDLRQPWEGYLVFPRWAEIGLGVVGHVETPTLVRGRTRNETEKALKDLTLAQVKAILDDALRRRAGLHQDHGDPESPPTDG